MKWLRYTCVLVCAVANTGVFAAGEGTVQSFRQEYAIRSVDMDSLAPEVSDAVAAGNIELRQQLRYEAAGKYLDVVTFAVPAGSSAVTPNALLPCDAPERFRVDLTSATVSGNSISLTGTVAPGAKMSVTNAAEGDSFQLTETYRTVGDSAVFRITNMSVGQQYVTAQAAGSVVLSAGPSKAPLISAADVVTAQPETQLDASASTDPNGGAPLDFSWRVVQGPMVLRDCRTATPTVQFAGRPGQYQLVVTAVNAAGASADHTVQITYLGR